jgi:hypothetical protein
MASLRILFLLTFGVVLGGWTGQAWAQEIRACVDSKGGLRIVADQIECKKKETILTWNQVGPPTSSVMIEDSNGALVGPVLSPQPLRPPPPDSFIVPLSPFSGYWTVGRWLLDLFILLSVSEDGFVESDVLFSASSPLVFESDDCTGPLFIQGFSPFKGFLSVGALVKGTTAYFPVEFATPFRRHVPSRLFFTDEWGCSSEGGSFTPPDSCCVDNALVGGTPAVIFDLSTLDLVPPFGIRSP